MDLQLPVQSVPITTKVVSSNPVHGELYSIQHYVIKFVNDLRQVGSFSGSSTNKTDRHDITEILLKLTLNTIHKQTLNIYNYHMIYLLGKYYNPVFTSYRKKNLRINYLYYSNSFYINIFFIHHIYKRMFSQSI